MDPYKALFIVTVATSWFARTHSHSNIQLTLSIVVSHPHTHTLSPSPSLPVLRMPHAHASCARQHRRDLVCEGSEQLRQ